MVRKMRAEPEEFNVVKTRDSFLVNMKPLEGKDPTGIFTAAPALGVVEPLVGPLLLCVLSSGQSCPGPLCSVLWSYFP